MVRYFVGCLETVQNLIVLEVLIYIKNTQLEKNMAYIDNYDVQKDMRKWFVTNAIYTSSHDLITKILMLDVDGDKLLVISDKTIIDIAKRNMKNIVPLYYDMKKAHATILNNETIYNGLISAFTGSNIRTIQQ